MSLHLRLYICAGVFLIALSNLARSEQIVVLSTYHNFPPFITGDGTGLTYELADYLSERSQVYKFVVQLLPRKRLDVMLEKEDMIVPWVTPVWFGKGAKDRFRWSKTLFEDGSVYVWSSQSDDKFEKPGDLIGRLLGGISGYRYVGVDQLVESGMVKRLDVATEVQLLQMIANRRVDVGIAPASGTSFIIKQQGWSKKYKIAAHHKFQRSLLIKTENRDLLDFINREVLNIHKVSDWNYIIEKYGITYELAMN